MSDSDSNAEITGYDSDRLECNGESVSSSSFEESSNSETSEDSSSSEENYPNYHECLECGRYYQDGVSNMFCDDCVMDMRYYWMELWEPCECKCGPRRGWCMIKGIHHIWKYKGLYQETPVIWKDGEKRCGCPQCLPN